MGELTCFFSTPKEILSKFRQFADISTSSYTIQILIEFRVSWSRCVDEGQDTMKIKEKSNWQQMRKKSKGENKPKNIFCLLFIARNNQVTSLVTFLLVWAAVSLDASSNTRGSLQFFPHFYFLQHCQHTSWGLDQ